MQRRTAYEDVNRYLSPRRIALLSLAITLAFYLVYTFTQYIGKPAFPSPNAKEDPKAERFDPDASHGRDAARFEEARPPHDLPPRQEHFEGHHPKGKEPHLPYLILLNAPLTFVMLFVRFLYIRRVFTVQFKKDYYEIVFNIVGTLLITIALSTLITVMEFKIWPNLPGPPKPLIHHIKIGWLGDLFLTIITLLTSYLLRSIYQRKKFAVENEELRTENIRSHYEALKSQLDPHFLFNSLNTLQTLVEMDRDKAGEYIQELSAVLRYTLQNKEMTTLEEELKCVQAYCSMMQIRYGDNLKFDFDIDDKYLAYNVLPLSIQGLIENAIKHNTISKRQPLTVTIATDAQGRVKVSNPIQPKVTEEEGNGIGLANLTERYRLRWDENVEISNDGTIFSVTLPLKENRNTI